MVTRSLCPCGSDIHCGVGPPAVWEQFLNGHWESCSRVQSLLKCGRNSDKYPSRHLCEINPWDLYRAECSCFANYNPFGLYIEPDSSRELCLLSYFEYPSVKTIFVFLFCWGVWKQREKKGNWALLLLKDAEGPRKCTANVTRQDCRPGCWAQPITFSVPWFSCLKSGMVLLVFESLCKLLISGCLEGEGTVWALLRWWDLFAAVSPSLLLTYRTESFVAVLGYHMESCEIICVCKKKFRAAFPNGPFHRASAEAMGHLCWLTGSNDVGAGAPFMVRSTFTATSLPCQGLNFLYSIPDCLQSSHFCCAETAFSQAVGQLARTDQAGTKTTLESLVLGVCICKTWLYKPSIWVWLFPA